MKKFSMKMIAAFAAAGMMALSLAGCGGSAGTSSGGSESTDGAAPAASGDDTVKVGLLHSLTGSMAISEKAVRDAEVLAIEEINAAGGVLGKQIVYVEEDGASEPSTFATKAEKLVDSEKVKTVFGCWTSSSRKAVKPVFEDYNSLLWYPVQYEGMEQSPNIVYTGAAPNQQIVPAIEYLIDKGYKKFFLLGSDYVFPRTANMIITAQVNAAGCEVVGEEYADMDQTDFAAIIGKIEAAQPEVIINTLNGTGNVSFFKQMAEKNYTSANYMTMSFSIAEEEVATIGADILKGHMVSWNYYQTTETDVNKAFVAAYKAKFGETRVTSDPAEAAYDAVYLWKAACEKAGSFEVDDVLGAIRTGEISFDAPEGTVTINGENQHLTKPVRIGEVREDGLIYEVYSTPSAVDPDPYLTTYDWAVAAGIQPIE
ncbi:MAG: urea ABC transporter substrate-binding protein [Oscillospiraceae bacterium]|nr:urea ABC transporter substrate-binding protein [Oscillospiraceae bacterium]MDY3791634.1 urea ABC transporter substrate-binding protein [Oscillospiraceae bacterium]MDY6208304.1 urea ABC transporter substrate-binding protein [Oscillospiraceae bacterium]